MHLIMEKNVYEVSVRKIAPGEFLGEKFVVTLQDEESAAIRNIEVKIGMLSLGDKAPKLDSPLFAARAACKHVRSNGEGDVINIHFGNIDQFSDKQVSDEKMDDTLRVLIHKFFKKHPRRTMKTLSPSDLFISTDYDFQKIVNKLENFVDRDILKYRSINGNEYELAKGGFEKLEALERSLKVRQDAGNRYFQLVSLSTKVKEPFVFVLMPFKPQEFDQKVYSDVIKPTVEEELGICCIRSDEETKPGVINNQIFTMILKAKLIIAETTTRNPNVFYEVGMAHAFNKDVFIFNSSSNKELPFDIITNKAVFYDDYDDLKKKIVENLKDHVS